MIGDATHPPVPCLSQVAQQGLGDSGTLALLLQNLCLDSQGAFLLDHINTALKVYNPMREPRPADILENAKGMGQMQQKGASFVKFTKTVEIHFLALVHVLLPLVVLLVLVVATRVQYSYSVRII